MKLREIYSNYLDKFKENNISELSLRIILCHIFKINDMSEFYIRQEDNFLMTKKDEKSILKVLSGTPVYYVTKEADFYNFKFNVNKNVLIPRPETELVVEEGVKEIKKYFSSADFLKIVDLGCGCGNIGIVVDKLILNKKETFGIDNSYFALNLAKKNAKKYNSNIKFVLSDLKKFVKKEKNINVVFSNPPYISKVKDVSKEVLDFEPSNALFVNPSYFYYEFLILNRKSFVADKYIMIFEINYDQKNILEGLLKNVLDLKNEEYIFKKDYNNLDRILIVKSLWNI